MFIDNEDKNGKVYSYIENINVQGNYKIVTGYFSIGALAYLIPKINQFILKYQLVLGDFIIDDEKKTPSLDLLNEDLSLDKSLKSNISSKIVVDFLKQENVEIKTLEPNFCHAKAYIFIDSNDHHNNNFYVFGSSNLTEAGIGLKKNNNLELNMFGAGSAAEYSSLRFWFDDNLWGSKKAKTNIKVGNKEISFKQYLIDEIEKIFLKYTPKEIYYKILYHLWGDKLFADSSDPNFTRKIGRLENTRVFNALYSFQQKAVLSLIKMLQDYNGAILADAVGLGKTWTALAVIKFFEYEGYKPILICPKKLKQNWEQFLEMGNRFYNDDFKYKIRFHTDLIDNLWERYDGGQSFPLSFVIDDSPKLIVIDESHNLRNDKSSRYKWLVDSILKECKGDVKVLMLSATPINNSFHDIRNQFKLMVRDDNKGFEETLGIRNINSTFNKVQKAFHIWTKEPNRKISTFIKKIEDTDFFKMTDALTVARTRKMVLDISKDSKGEERKLVFPKKEKPLNVRVTPKQIGNFDNFEELFDKFPPMLSAYQPTFYLPNAGKVQAIYDEKKRDFFLVKMMYILLVKRLESSWYSFMSTVLKVKEHHQNSLDKINEYEKFKRAISVDNDYENVLEWDDDTEIDFEEYSIGKRQVSLLDIDSAGNLQKFKNDIKKDLDSLDVLYTNLERFNDEIVKETLIPMNHKSKDEKLAKLIELISKKREEGHNNGNKKVLIFSAFHDTVKYLYDQLSIRGFKNIAMVSGSESKSVYHPKGLQKFEPILEQFAPYTKLYNEKEWNGFIVNKSKSNLENYELWLEWIKSNHPDIQNELDSPIDILIATDCLSEGQNLQDCDYVINYDIHWNPVRILQRCGRIDRLGSPNEIIFSANFWPTNNINNYLNLESRIQNKMIAMKMAGSEIDKEFSEEFKSKLDADSLDTHQTENMLKQLETSWEDIERSDETLGFDSFSFELFRQDLLAEINAHKDKYENMPNAVFSGLKLNDLKSEENFSLVALLGYPTRPANKRNYKYNNFELIYIDVNGKSILLNQKDILDFLISNKEKPRNDEGLDAIDRGEPESIKLLSDAIRNWFKASSVNEYVDKDGNNVEVAGKGVLDQINQLKRGNKEAVNALKSNVEIDEKFNIENYDLITWLKIN